MRCTLSETHAKALCLSNSHGQYSCAGAVGATEIALWVPAGSITARLCAERPVCAYHSRNLRRQLGWGAIGPCNEPVCKGKPILAVLTSANRALAFAVVHDRSAIVRV